MNSKIIILITLISIAGIGATYEAIDSFRDLALRDSQKSGVSKEMENSGEPKLLSKYSKYIKEVEPSNNQGKQNWGEQIEGVGEIQIPNESIREPESGDSIQDANGNLSTRRTIQELLSSNATLKCDNYTVSSNDDFTEAVLYLTDNKLKGNIVMKRNGQIQESNVLKLNNDIYVWADNNAVGIKLSLGQNQNLWDIQELAYFTQIGDYACSATQLKGNEFELPENVKFTELSQSIEELMQDPEALCILCAQSGDPKIIEECRVQLGCQ